RGSGRSPRSSAHVAVFSVDEPRVLRLPRLAAATFWGDEPRGHLSAGPECVFQPNGARLSVDEAALWDVAALKPCLQVEEPSGFKPEPCAPWSKGIPGLTRRWT